MKPLAILAMLFAPAAVAQTVNAGAIPFPSSYTLQNNVVHITDSTPIHGLQRLDPVFLPNGWSLVSIGGAWFLMTNAPPPPPTLQGLTAWMTMAQSALDSNTWCLGVPSVGPTAAKDIQPVMLDIWTSVQTAPGTIGAGMVTEGQGLLRIQKSPDPSQVNPGVTSALPPLWNADACGAGLPGVQFPSTWLSAGESRTNVQVLVVY